jgi:3-oxoacyl-[acyl-carrier-protein] synthase-3
MVHTKVSHLKYYLPTGVLTNEDLRSEFPELDIAKTEEKLGIKKRHICGSDETALDLAVKASEEVLQDFNKSEIDFVILCTQSPDYFLPTSACILQDRLGLNKSIGALDYNLGCSGFVYGLAIAKGLIKASVASNVLLVTSETYSKYLHKRDRGNRSIFGDGAAATIVSVSDKDQIFDFVLGTDGEGKDKLIVHNGAMRNAHCVAAPEIVDKSGNITTENHLIMKGPDIFNFTIRNIPKAFNNCLAKNNIKLDDIDFVIFHQANKYMLEYLRKKIDIPNEKFYINLKETGNTVSSTIPIALYDCLKENKIRSGDKVMLVGFGVGLSWAMTIIEI